MTRQEFIENVTTFDDLVDFCSENDLVSCEYILDEDGLDEYIEDNIYDWSRYDRWYELRDRLNEIQTGFDWYDVEYGIEPVEDWEFERYKEATLREADEYKIWEDCEEDDEDTADVDDMVDGDELISKLIAS